MKHDRRAGFTLLEVLVALAVLAIALTAAVRAAGMGVDAARDARDRTLAGWIAEDRLNGHIALRDWPSTGDTHGSAAEDNTAFDWQETVAATDNPDFRKLTVTVYAPGSRHALDTLTGYLVKPAGAQ